MLTKPDGTGVFPILQLRNVRHTGYWQPQNEELSLYFHKMFPCNFLMSYRYVGLFLTTWTQFPHELTTQKSLNWKDYSWSSNVNMTPLLNFFPTQQPFPIGCAPGKPRGQPGRSGERWQWKTWRQLRGVLKVRQLQHSREEQKGPLSLLSPHSSVCSPESRQESKEKDERVEQEQNHRLP